MHGECRQLLQLLSGGAVAGALQAAALLRTGEIRSLAGANCSAETLAGGFTPLDMCLPQK